MSDRMSADRVAAELGLVRPELPPPAELAARLADWEQLAEPRH